jgi:SAM-dependent methyltransferase
MLVTGTGAALHARPLVYDAPPDAVALSAEKRLVLARVGAAGRVLEIGAHTGTFSAALRASGCAVTAVEADPRAAALAAPRAERLLVGSIEDAAVQARLGGPYDVVLCMHVLEHLVDPWAVLRALRGRVGAGGRLLALLPNVGCWRVRKALFLQGRFEYEETGILDRTHLRFFTLASARQLVRSSGWSEVTLTPVDVCVPLARRLGRLPIAGRLAGRWERLLASRLPNLCTEIVLIEARAQGRA